MDDREADEQRCSCVELVTGNQCESCDQDGVDVDGKCVYRECVVTYPDGTIGECNGIGVCGKLDGRYQCICSQLDSYTIDRFTCLAYACLASDLTKGVCYRHGFCKGESVFATRGTVDTFARSPVWAATKERRRSESDATRQAASVK